MVRRMLHPHEIKMKSKYKSLSEWIKAEPDAYRAARRKGLLDKICKQFGWKRLINPSGFWTLETCKESALRYKTKKQWKINSAAAYVSACNNDWIEECCKHMIEVQKPNGYWTLKQCKLDALKYETRHAWQKAKNTGYWAAKNNKWIDICCKHMKPVNGPRWTLDTCKAVALKYKTKSEWKKNSSASCEAARKNGWFDKCVKHMKKHGNSKV